jgi:2,4-dienoyl-CoA reductase-like NADH-dependent reductase (Old Yellow Enzyme family)
MTDLFSPLDIKDVRLKNRIAMSPMCQYSATDGLMDAWHMVNLGSRAVGGAGLVVAEAAAVSPEARITLEDLGLWNDAQVEACRPVVEFIKRQGAVPGVQLAHSGRMGGMLSPWNGNDYLPEDDPYGWQPIAPSGTAIGGPYARLPRAMTLADIDTVKQDFAASARRAADAGFEWLELHFGHSYLLQNFFSPLANRRTDRYGGSFENRARLLLETFEDVRAAWPERLPLMIRLGVTDFVAGEQPMEEVIELVRQFKSRGLDIIDVTLGFNSAQASAVPWAQEAFMTPTAERIRREVGILTATSWNIREPELADALVRDGKVDLIMLGRALLADPYWPYHAAQALRRPQPQATLPIQYAVWLHGRETIGVTE